MKRLIQFFRPFITSLNFHFSFSRININSENYRVLSYFIEIFIRMKQFYIKFYFFFLSTRSLDAKWLDRMPAANKTTVVQVRRYKACDIR